MTSTLTKLTDWTYLAHSTLRIRWSYPNPDTPAMALAASSRRWKLIKANPCWKQDEITEPCSVSVQCQQFFKKGKENTPTLSSWYLKKYIYIYKNDNNKVKHSIFTFTGTLDRQHVCVFSYEQKTKHCSQFISYTVLERSLLRNCCWHFIKSNVRFITDLRLSRVLVLGQIDPWDWAKWSEELLQVCLTGVLRQVGDTNGSIVISCQKQTVFLLNNTWGCAGIINHNTTTITPPTGF